MFYDLFVFHKLESIAPTTVKLGDDSTGNCTQISEVVLNISDGRHLRPPSELSDYTPLYRWRFELTMQYTGSIYQAL
jgi:hypothetical protein